MRARIASALFVSFASLSLPHFAAGQSSTTSSQPPKETPKKPLFDAKSLEFALATQIASLQRQGGSANDPATTQQGLKTWTDMVQHQREGLVTKSFGSGPDAPNCAHIRIIQAPEMDSEMVVQISPGDGGPIQTFHGLPPCRRDLPARMAAERFYGPPMLQVPPRTPFVPPPASRLPSAQARSEQPSTNPTPKP